MSVTESTVRSSYRERLPVLESEDLPLLDYDEGRERIAGLIETEPSYRVLFDQMMGVVKEFVEFDWAYLFVFSEGRSYSRIACRYGPDVPFQSRWFKTFDGYRDWITKPTTWADDLETMIRQGPDAEELLKLPDFKICIKAGFRALLALPVQEGGEVLAALCLYSKKQAIYQAKHRRILERLMLGQALLTIFHAADRAERDFVSDLTKKIADSKDSEALARTVVRELARFYEFQNVSIFKVNALRGHFELLAQALARKKGSRIRPGYTQSLRKGLLGEAYRTADYVLLKNVNDGSREARIYVPTTNETQSELCIPIKLSGRILWILNLEDTHTEAFTRGQFETLKGIIEQIQANLDRIFQRLVLRQVIDVLPDAVVITKQSGRILHCSKGALELLEFPANVTKENLSTFLKADFLKLGRSATPAEVVGAGRKTTSVLVQKFKLEEEYDYVVVVLQDVKQINWKFDSELFKTALAEAAAQVRVPISLLSSFVRQIRQNVTDDNVKDLTGKALRQLGRIELTYDRVLASYDARTIPAARKERVDVNSALEYVLGELPNLERKAVRVSAGKARAIVNADRCRVLFAIGSMLAYLLRSRADSRLIEVAVRTGKEGVEVSMTGAIQQVEPRDELAKLVESTRAQIALGEEALARIAGDCGGEFKRRSQANGREKLTLRLAVTK